MTYNEMYLGRLYDSQNKKTTENKFTYDPGDLTTHGVVTGMTGSGKTGLCITLLEEAALQGIPAIIIDPKGDLTNLLLHFPNLAPRISNPGLTRRWRAGAVSHWIRLPTKPRLPGETVWKSGALARTD